MELRKSRKIICVLLTFVVTVGMILTVGTMVFRLTICSSGYMGKLLSSGSIVSACDESYNACLETLEEESGIPVHVFQAAKDYFIVTETAVDRVYAGKEATLYGSDKVEIYERFCKEYLDGNDISYNKKDIHRAAERATEIYSECYGISDSQSVSEFLSYASQRSTGIIAFGLLLIILPTAVITTLFSKKDELLAQLLTTLSCAGFGTLIFGITGLLFGVTDGMLISPEVYLSAIEKTIRLDFVYVIVIGALLSAVFVFTAIRTNSKYIEKKIREKY